MYMRETLERCFKNPRDYLGGIERNVEVKIVFLTLIDLGWDPAANLGLNFQIPKNNVENSAAASLAIDLVARDDDGICIAGEVKAHHKVKLDVHIPQILRYRNALGAPLAFLTNGRRWMIFRENENEPFIDITFTSVDQMLETLRQYLRPGVIKGNYEKFDWNWGINHENKSSVEPLKDIMSKAIESTASEDLTTVRIEEADANFMKVRQDILDEVDRLAAAYADKVYRAHTENAAQLKWIGSNDAFVEIRFGPDNLKKYPEGYIVSRKKALSALPVPDDVKNRLTRYYRHELENVSEFIKETEALIGYL